MKYSSFWKTTIGAGLLIMITICNLTDIFRGLVPSSEAHATTQRSQLSTTSLSYQCISCHDGSVGQKIMLKSADTPLKFTGHINTDHPVGMRYSEYAQREPRSYVNPTRLDNRIRLENGEVTCISCHQTNVNQVTTVTGQIPVDIDCMATGALTVTSKRTGLCMSCHVL